MSKNFSSLFSNYTIITSKLFFTSFVTVKREINQENNELYVYSFAFSYCWKYGISENSVVPITKFITRNKNAWATEFLIF